MNRSNHGGPRGPYEPKTHPKHAEIKAGGFTVELCTTCHESVVWNGKAWCDRHDEDSWSEHRHQPGNLGKLAEHEASGASARGRYGQAKRASKDGNDDVECEELAGE